MGFFDVLQVVLSLLALVILTPIVGSFMTKVFQGEKHGLRFLRPFENLIYKLCGIDEQHEMDWKEYAFAVLIFNFLGLVVVFLLQVFQGVLPLNPQHLPGVSWHLALNTAISFVTNTNWQSYSGENTLSYFTQMAGLAVQNFLSAAVGFAVFLALARGFSRKLTNELGNYWVDMTRAVLYILLPASFILALILVGQGVVQNFSSYITAHTLEGGTQLLPMGPAASQIAIKQLGTNGGGFFNANSAHPFENPTPLSNWLELIAILLFPAGLTYTFGQMVKARKQGWVIFAAMFILLVGGLTVSLWAEYSPNHFMQASHMMEGKETRFGVTNSVMWSVFTTAASNGSVNSMHASLSPLSGMVALLNMMLGEIIFGGIGCGLYGMLLFVLLTVFLAGLMVGRTPEYLGKKIEAREIKWVIVAVLAPSAMMLLGAGISAVLPMALASFANKGPHGLTELLYAYTSAASNNGSAFAGLNTNTPYFNLTLGLAMLVGRFAVLFPVLAIAGSMAQKKSSPPSFGTFTTDNFLFVVLLVAVIFVVGALTFFPALSLGPILEHFLMNSGRGF